MKTMHFVIALIGISVTFTKRLEAQGGPVYTNGAIYPTGYPENPAPTRTLPFLTATPTNIAFRSLIFVKWSLTNIPTPIDRIIMVETNTPDSAALETKFTLLRGGDTAFLASDPGTYEFRYIRWTNERVLVSSPVTVIPFLPDRTKVRNYPSGGTRVIVFGDSIALGVGAGNGADLASILSTRLGTPVMNAGRSGDTTRDALQRLDADVLSRDPQIVIVILGANDERPLAGQLQPRVPRSETGANLREIVRRIHEKGAMVFFLGVLDFIPEVAALYQGFVQETGIAYLPDIMQDLWLDPRFMADAVHPDSRGYERIARRIAPAAEWLYVPRGPRIAILADEVSIRWSAAGGVTYRLIASTNLALPLTRWSTVAEFKTSAETELSIAMPRGKPYQFFALRNEP